MVGSLDSTLATSVLGLQSLGRGIGVLYLISIASESFPLGQGD